MKLDDLLAPVPEAQRSTIALAGAADPELLRCVAAAIEGQLGKFILVGDRSAIRAAMQSVDADLASVPIVHVDGDAPAIAMAAAQLVADGTADIPMKGQVPTGKFMKALLHDEFGFVQEGRRISHVAIFEVRKYHKPFLMTDGGINIDGSLETKIHLVRNAVEMAASIGIVKPKVACLAPIEYVNKHIESTVIAEQLKEMGERGEFGDIIIDGPLALDNAIDLEAAKEKGRVSPVAGDPDILVMPSMASGNVFYKSLMLFAGARAAGNLVGTSIPAIVTSRADDQETRLLSIGLAVNIRS